MRCCEEEEIYEDWRDNPKNFPEDQTLFNLNDKTTYGLNINDTEILF